jgi:hypothetical protein
MDHISIFLTKIKDIENKGVLFRKKVQEIIQKHIKQEIDISKIIIKDKEIIINYSGSIKNAIFLVKENILEDLKGFIQTIH